MTLGHLNLRFANSASKNVVKILDKLLDDMVRWEGKIRHEIKDYNAELFVQSDIAESHCEENHENLVQDDDNQPNEHLK